MEQHVDIPDPGGGGKNACLQGSLPEQSSTAPLSSAERLSERIVEQIVGSLGGGLQDFRPVQSSSSSSHLPAGILGDADEPGEGVFRTFPQLKKSAKLGPHSSPRVHASVSSSTPAPQHTRLTAWVMIHTDQGPYYWDRRTGETLANGGRIQAFLVAAA